MIKFSKKVLKYFNVIWCEIAQHWTKNAAVFIPGGLGSASAHWHNVSLCSEAVQTSFYLKNKQTHDCGCVKQLEEYHILYLPSCLKVEYICLSSCLRMPSGVRTPGGNIYLQMMTSGPSVVVGAQMTPLRPSIGHRRQASGVICPHAGIPVHLPYL